jgi:CBS domain-containing protein
MVRYKAIEIYTSETARICNKPIVDALTHYVRDRKIAARMLVTRGIAGCYEDGEIATGRLEVLSYNMPVRIDIILPEGEASQVLQELEEMVDEGIVALRDVNVLIHKVKNSFFPRHLKVLDVMTRNPESVACDRPLIDAARLLLSSIFTGLPVVDEKGRPKGVITQGDLIRKGGLPLRPGLISESDPGLREDLLKILDGKIAQEVMTEPAITIREDRPLSEAVDRMLAQHVKRLPVVDGSGRLTGIVSRIDIFRTVMREAPDWSVLKARNTHVQVDHLKRVGEILRRDTHTVLPDTPIKEVIRIIDQNDIQRVAVVDRDGRLLGLISDRDLLCYFKPEQEGIFALLSRWKHSLKENSSPGDLKKRLIETLASHVMRTQLITVTEETPIENAMRIMTEKALKRLPVVDAVGRFKGMLSRDSLLRTGYQGK